MAASVTRDLPDQMHERSVRVFCSGPNFRFRAHLCELGPDDFKFIVLERVRDLDQLRKREAFWIRKLGALNPEMGDSINRIHAPCLGLELIATRLLTAYQSARTYHKNTYIGPYPQSRHGLQGVVSGGVAVNLLLLR